MDVKDQSINELKMKRMVLEKIIEEAKAKGDERWKNVAKDLEILVTEIQRRIPPTVVKLKPAEVTARAPSPNEERSDG